MPRACKVWGGSWFVGSRNYVGFSWFSVWVWACTVWDLGFD